jgi:hypothetical protein
LFGGTEGKNTSVKIFDISVRISKQRNVEKEEEEGEGGGLSFQD